MIEEIIKEANEKLTKSVRSMNDPALVIPRLEGKQVYSVKELLEQSKDRDTEVGKVIRMGVRGLLRRTGR
jgi:hypothetical protein